MRPPNFLLITADQQRADCLGMEGRRIRTPHLDQLAQEGTCFTAGITSNVVCQPSRVSILTGQLCRTHGVHDNGIDLNPAIGEQGFARTRRREVTQRRFLARLIFPPTTPLRLQVLRSACNPPLITLPIGTVLTWAFSTSN